MYLLDTNIVSEARKRERANPGVSRFFAEAIESGQGLFLSAISVGELRRGVALIRHRGDAAQAQLLATWLDNLLAEYADCILDFDRDAAQLWGHLRVPDASHAIDNQIAAIALLYDLTVVTRNAPDFAGTGVRVLNPFEENAD